MGKGFLENVKKASAKPGVKITDSSAGSPDEDKILIQIGESKAARIAETEVQNSQPEINLEAISKLIEQKLTESSQASQQAFEEQIKAIEEAKAKELEDKLNEIEAKKAEELAQAQQQHEQALTALKEQLDKLQSEQKETERVKNNLADLFKLTGSAQPNTNAMKFPNVNTHVASNADKLDGLYGEWVQVLESVPKSRHYFEGSKNVVVHDTTEIDAYVKKFGAPSRQNELVKAMTEMGRRQGWFQGKSVVDGNFKEDATKATDLIGGYLPLLSSFMRITHRPGFIFWQFPVTVYNHQAGKGTEIQIPRFAYLNSSTNVDDYKLSGAGTFASLVNTADNLQSGVVTAVLEEYGRGKAGAGTAISPVVIPTFVNMTSAYDLMMVLDRNLAMDYARFEDRKIRALWSATSRIVYNDANTVTTTPGNVGAGDNGTFTRRFADALVTYAWTNQIEPLPDNTFGYVHTPVSLQQYKEDFVTEWEAPTEADLQALSNMLNPTTIPPEDFARVVGYQGKYNNIHHFVTNAYGTGAAGTEGVQSTTLGVGARTTRTGYLFGNYSIGRGISMPFEVRLSELNNFGRYDAYTWLSYESFTALDVDAAGYSDTSDVPQQTRVVQVRTTDVAV